MNKIFSFINWILRFVISPQAVFLLLLLASSCHSKKKAILQPSLEGKISIETDVSFQYEQFKGPIYGLPSAPNIWHVKTKLTNSSLDSIEVLPIYMYSEAQPSKTMPFTNSGMICPKAYDSAFSPFSSGQLVIAPQDSTGELRDGVEMPIQQLDSPLEPSDLVNKGVVVGSQKIVAAIAMDAKPVSWKQLEVGPQSSINADWEFQSTWAAPRKTRTDSTFEIVCLGPILRSVPTEALQVFLVVNRLKCLPTESSGRMQQTSFKLLQITPNLPSELSMTFPNNRSSVVEFSNAVLKIAKNQ